MNIFSTTILGNADRCFQNIMLLRKDIITVDSKILRGNA